jgi:hypothetical protein
LRVRCFVNHVGKISVWMIVLALVSLGWACLLYITGVLHLRPDITIVCYGAALGTALLLARFRWPQLTRPAAIMVIAVGGLGNACVLGQLGAMVRGNGWDITTVTNRLLLAVPFLAILAFAVFLGGKAWQAHQQYSSWVPKKEKCGVSWTEATEGCVTWACILLGLGGER